MVVEQNCRFWHHTTDSAKLHIEGNSDDGDSHKTDHEIYHNGTKKFETTADGVDLSGTG